MGRRPRPQQAKLEDRSYGSFGAVTGYDGTRYYSLSMCQPVDKDPIVTDAYGDLAPVNPKPSADQTWVPAGWPVVTFRIRLPRERS